MRNPFYLRAAEQVDSDSAFLGLFDSGVLELLLPIRDSIWDRAFVLRSAPGGGKTSLLRLFTPGVLSAVKDYPGQADLFNRLVDLGALNSEGAPQVLGVRISLDANYDEIDYLDIPEQSKVRAFCGLLNARIIAHVLRNALKLNGMQYPYDLSSFCMEVREESPSIEESVAELGGTTGPLLQNTARRLERSVLDLMDSLDRSAYSELKGSRCLHSIRLIGSSSIKVGNRRLPPVLLMFDDAHKLVGWQRQLLATELMDRSLSLSRWVAERRQAMRLEEIVEEGSKPGRDFVIVSLEDDKETAFRRRCFQIADRRVRLAGHLLDANPSFDSFLSSSADVPPHVWGTIVDTIRQRIVEGTKGTFRFGNLVSYLDETAAPDFTGAREWRKLEIYVNRVLSRQQLQFDLEIGVNEFAGSNSSNDFQAAELLMAKEFKLPYYYGADKIATLASKNVDQFLSLAGDLFEEIAVSATLGRGTRLAPDRQHKIINEVAVKYLRSIVTQVRHGHDVLSLIMAIGNLSKEATYMPTASYAPGVTGTAILWSDYLRLVKSRPPELDRLYLALESAIAHNIIEISDSPPTKCKGREYLVLYLNRLLCVPFGLPLWHGGFRERRLDALVSWVSDSTGDSIEQRRLF